MTADAPVPVTRSKCPVKFRVSSRLNGTYIAPGRRTGGAAARSWGHRPRPPRKRGPTPQTRPARMPRGAGTRRMARGGPADPDGPREGKKTLQKPAEHDLRGMVGL